jgi:clan AA aspartic protease (TIGR02281 family)
MITVITRLSALFWFLISTLILCMDPGNAETIQLEEKSGTYLVPVIVNGSVSLPFLLDTGATDVLIPADVALTLSRTGTLAENDFIGSRTYLLADGSKLPSARFILRELRIGSYNIRNVTASLGSVHSTPLLGQSFLSRFPSWTVDNSRHVLVLSEQPGAIGSTARVINPPTDGRGGFGSIAYDAGSGRRGVAWNYDSEQGAEAAAMRECGAECRVVVRFGPKMCVAIATPELGKGIGAASRSSIEEAKSAAIADCKKHNSAECVLRDSRCNR